ncbi:MAG: hypothetical protein ABIJ16_02720 [Bacteroidota bacterium]
MKNPLLILIIPALLSSGYTQICIPEKNAGTGKWFITNSDGDITFKDPLDSVCVIYAITEIDRPWLRSSGSADIFILTRDYDFKNRDFGYYFSETTVPVNALDDFSLIDSHYSEEMPAFSCMKDGKWGVVCEKKLLIPFSYDSALLSMNTHPGENGGVFFRLYLNGKNGIGFLNKKGYSEIVPCMYDSVVFLAGRCELPECHAIACRLNGKYAMFSRTGKKLTDFIYDSFGYCSDKDCMELWCTNPSHFWHFVIMDKDDNTFVVFRRDNKFGYMNLNGEEVGRCVNNSPDETETLLRKDE